MSVLLFLLVFFLGMLSMGLQLVASRVLAPFFGNSIFVWASLITTFLAAFSSGSFIGASISNKSFAAQSRIMAGLMSICSGTLFFDSLACYAVCDWLDLQIDNLPVKLLTTCILLYFAPITALSAITPVCVGFYHRRGESAGRSAGLLNGVSALGNIAGVLLAGLVLIPAVGIRSLLHVWWISSVAIQFSLWFILYSAYAQSRWRLSVPALERPHQLQLKRPTIT